MRQIKRIISDIRGKGQTEQDTENIVNKTLMELQTNNQGNRNTNVEIVRVNEITKDSGIMVFIVEYEDKGLDVQNKE